MTDTIPSPAPQPVAQKNSRATGSLVLGIVSLFFNPLAIATILGIIFGILGLRAAPALGHRNRALVGIILSVIGFFVGIVVFFAIVSGIGSAANTASKTLDTPAAVAPQTAEPSDTAPAAAAPTKAPVSTKAPAETKAPSEKVVPAEYLNALAQAKSYDETAHLSKKGLLNQLTSQYGGKFPKAAATYAVDHVGANWKANALTQAKSYEETASLSNAALHDQLVSPYGGQFTESEADYAVKHVND